jgi:adenine-specific DNA methylase
MTPFPAPNRLHVWWARRPLVASRAAVLASLLPADADHGKFMRVLGIHGDRLLPRRASPRQLEKASGWARMRMAIASHRPSGDHWASVVDFLPRVSWKVRPD